MHCEVNVRICRDLSTLCSALVIVSVCCAVRCEITLEKHAYKDVVVRVAADVKPTDVGEFFNRLEALLRSSSKVLSKATNGLWYFAEFRILLPPGFEAPPNLLVRNATWELFNDGDVIVNGAGAEASARQSRGCGRPGDAIFLPEGSVLSADLEASARSFVRRWVQVRYGVFDETATAQSPRWCYEDVDVWKPTGCYSTNATVKRLRLGDEDVQCTEEDVNMEDIFENRVGPASSLLFTSTPPEVVLLCDSSGKYRHQPLAPTKHNLICDGQSAWDVIRMSNDYKMTHTLDRLRTTPPTSFIYVTPAQHHYIYLVQKCASGSGSYHTIMAAANEGFRRFIVFSAPEVRSWRLALLYGNSTRVHREFQERYTWEEYLKPLDSNVVDRCNVPSESALQEVMKAVPEGVPTTAVLLLHGSMLSTKTLQMLKHEQTLRLSVVLLDADDVKGDVLNKAPSNTKFYIVPSYLDQETMAALIDLALHDIHHGTASLYGDITKVYQKTSTLLGNGINGTFSAEPFTTGTLTFIVSCSNIFNIADSDAMFDGERMRSYREKMSLFATQKQFQNASGATWTYAVSATKSQLKCSAMASVMYPVNESHMTVRGWFERSMVDPSKDGSPQALLVEFRSGGHNISDIKVNAQVYRSGSTSQQQQTVELLDDGLLQPDITSGDGIYSAYFVPEAVTPAWYTVIVRVTGTLVSSTIATHRHSTNEEHSGTTEKKFFREEMVGSFWANSGPVNKRYSYPFGKIYDLKVVDLSYPNVTFEWTAPRGLGAINAPEPLAHLRFSTNIQDLLKSDQFSKLPGWNLPISSALHELGTVTLQFPKVHQDATNNIYYVAVRTVDQNQRHSRISNIVQIAPNTLKHTTETVMAVDVTSVSGPVAAKEENMTENGTALTGQTPTDASTQQPTDMVATQEPTEEALFFRLFQEPRFYWLLAAVVTVIIIIIVINIVCCLVRRKRTSSQRQKEPLQTLCRDVATTMDYQDNSGFDDASLDSLKLTTFNEASTNGSITPIQTPLQAFSVIREGAKTEGHKVGNVSTPPAGEVHAFSRTAPLHRRRLPRTGNSTVLPNSSTPEDSNSPGRLNDPSGAENVKNAELYRERGGYYYDLGYL